MNNQTEVRKGRMSVGLENRLRLQNPLLLTDPTITGTPNDGQTMTCNLGTYRAGASVSGEEFQWFNWAMPIDGEDTNEHVAVEGENLSCRVRVLYGDQYHYWFTERVLIEA